MILSRNLRTSVILHPYLFLYYPDNTGRHLSTVKFSQLRFNLPKRIVMSTVQYYPLFFQKFNGYIVKVHAGKSQYAEGLLDDFTLHRLIYNRLQAKFVIA